MKRQKRYAVASAQLHSPHRVSSDSDCEESVRLRLLVVCLRVYVCVSLGIKGLSATYSMFLKRHFEWSTLWYTHWYKKQF